MAGAIRFVLLAAMATAGVLWASLGIKTANGLPDHAMLLVNTEANSYVTVPCVIRGTVDQSYVANVEAVIAGSEEVWYEPFVEPMTKREAKAAAIEPDRVCANADGFISWEPWLHSLLGWRKERVTADGTVLW